MEQISFGMAFLLRGEVGPGTLYYENSREYPPISVLGESPIWRSRFSIRGKVRPSRKGTT